jgi:hypothetical protein
LSDQESWQHMADSTSEFRKQLIDDYQGALIRLATLRANGQQYLLFAWVELFPFDMRIPDRWTAGAEPWRVPKTDSWTCGFSAWPVSVATALDWYEAAAKGDLTIGASKGRKIKIQTTQFGPEPAYGGFCAGVDPPFELRWHDGPRVHRYVSLVGNPEPVRQLGFNDAARAWLNLNLGFNPYEFDEWLGGLALLAPDPICAAVNPCLTARADDGRETLTVQVVPRRSVARGIADVSSLSVHVAERRFGSWQSVRTIPLASAGNATTFENPQWYGEVGYVLVCRSRGLLRFVEPQSGIEQIGIGMHASDTILNIEVPADGQKKPAKTVSVMRFRRSQISVGAALNDAVRSRIIAAQERRRMRQERAHAPQKILGSQRYVKGGPEIRQKRQEAEDFIAGLVGRAQTRVIFVDPFFGLRQTRLFALRVSNTHVRVRILTGQQGLKLQGESRQRPRSLLAADLAYLASIAKEKSVVVPAVRVMQGGDTPAIHDRYIVIDDEVWHCGPSFNELGARLGVVVRLPNPIPVRREINAVWSQSTPLAEVSAKSPRPLMEWIAALWEKVRGWRARS